VWNRRLWRYVLPVFATVFLAFGLVDIGPAWRAAHGGGHAGTLTLQSRFCNRWNCTWRGQFRSDDAAARRDNVRMHDAVPEGPQVGSELPARDAGDRTGVFAQSNSNSWHIDAVFLVASGGFLAGWAGWLIIAARRGRRGTRPTAIPGDLMARRAGQPATDDEPWPSVDV
jgi:hypothetical protein